MKKQNTGKTFIFLNCVLLRKFQEIKIPVNHIYVANFANYLNNLRE